MSAATPPIPLRAFFLRTRKVNLFKVPYLASITVITYLNNIIRLVFIMERVVFSARQELVFHNFTPENLCLNALKDFCLGFIRREESNLLASNSHNR